MSGRILRGGLTSLAGAAFLAAAAIVRGGEPPALNPFGSATNPTGVVQREDAIPGYMELSTGAVYYGRLFLTRDKRLQVDDKQLARQRLIPLEAVKRIDAKVIQERMDREWRFKEMSNDEKYYTGRTYPMRELVHILTLKDGRTIEGGLSGVFYIIPGDYEAKPGQVLPEVEPERFTIYKRQHGNIGDSVGSLIYVKTIKLGEDAFKEGKAKYKARGGKQKSAPASAAKSSRTNSEE